VVAPAIFGITNDGLNLAVKLLLLFLVAIWLALVFWTYADARRRVGDPMLVTCAAAAAFFFPFVGSIVYAIVRPPEYLEDARERELEIAAAEARLLQVQDSTCPHCGHDIEKTFLRCPHCTRRLKEPCTNCARPLDPRWQMCPYCEAEVVQQTGGGGQRRRGRRPTASAAEPGPERSAPARQTAAAREPARETREAPRPRPAREGRAAPDPDARASTREDSGRRSMTDGPARVLRDPEPRGNSRGAADGPGRAPAPPDPGTRMGDTAEQPTRRPRPSADPA
jgi:hypothetical protein